MNPLLPNAVCLITMSDDELREELCKEIYNKANLREMIRRLVKLSLSYAKIADDAVEQMFDYKSALNLIKQAVQDVEEG